MHALVVAALRFDHRKRRRRRAIRPLRSHVREHFAAVDALPDERLVGELVVRVPGQLDGHEIVLAAALEDLRKGCRIAEHVGEPHHPRRLAELAAEEFLAVDELTNYALARRQIAVVLRPHRALKLYPAVRDRLFEAVENVGVSRLDPIHQLRLRSAEDVVGIFVQIDERGRVGARALALGLPDRPQPTEVDVRVSDRGIFSRIRRSRRSRRRSEQLARHRDVALAVLSARLVEHVVYLILPLARQRLIFARRQKQRKKLQKVIVKSGGLVVSDREHRPLEPCLTARLVALAVEAAVDEKPHLFAALGAVEQVYLLFAGRRRDPIDRILLLRDADDGLAVDIDKSLALHVDQRDHLFALCGSRDFALEIKPRAVEVAPPRRPRLDGVELLFAYLRKGHGLAAERRLSGQRCDDGIDLAPQFEQEVKILGIKRGSLDHFPPEKVFFIKII